MPHESVPDFVFVVQVTWWDVQVNPFMETTAGEICCVDAKIGFDDNADYRQKEIHALRDTSQEVGGCAVSLRVLGVSVGFWGEGCVSEYERLHC